MKNKIKAVIKKAPFIYNPTRGAHRIMLRLWWGLFFPGSRKFWERRYASGRTSGYGSYGKFAKTKAGIITSFVKENKIKSVIDFGCGDGNQLSFFKFPKYIGLDVSGTAISLCMQKFKNDKTKSFFLYDLEYFKDNGEVFKAELGLSLDVILHLVEDKIFKRYMERLFSSSSKFVIIHSVDIESKQIVDVKHRHFTKWIKNNLHNWELFKKIKNKHPEMRNVNFFIYKKMK